MRIVVKLGAFLGWLAGVAPSGSPLDKSERLGVCSASRTRAACFPRDSSFLGVAGAARDHYTLLVFGLVLSIILMATAATLISKWIKKYRWIGWIGLFAILFVAIELIYTDIKLFL